MTRLFVAEEVPSTIIAQEKLMVNMQGQDQGLILAAMTAFNAAYLSHPKKIEITCLLKEAPAFVVESQHEFLDFKFLTRFINRTPNHFDTLATINEVGQLMLHKIGVKGVESEVIEIPNFVKEPLQMSFVESDLVVIRYENSVVLVHNEQDEWITIQKPFSTILDLRWSSQMKVFFVLSTQNRIGICERTQFTQLNEVKLGNHYTNQEQVTQIVLFETQENLRECFSQSQEYECDYLFATLNNLGEIAIWSMKSFNTQKKLYSLVETLNLFCQNDFMHSARLEKNALSIKMDLNHFGNAMVLSGMAENNTLAYYFLQINTDPNKGNGDNHIIRSVTVNSADGVTNPLMLVSCAHQDHSTHYFRTYELEELSELITHIQDFLYPELLSPEQSSIAYLLATLSDNSINFSWVYGEGLWGKSQISEKRIIQDVEYEKPHSTFTIPDDLIKVQETQLQPDQFQKVEEKQSPFQVPQSGPISDPSPLLEPAERIDKKFMQMLIREIAEDKTFISLVTQQIQQDQGHEEMQMDQFKEGLVAQFTSQFAQIEYEIEATLNDQLGQVTQYCEDLVSTTFSQSNLQNLVNQSFEQMVFAGDSQEVLRTTTEQYFQDQIVPMYQKELTELSMQIGKVLARTTQVFQEAQEQDTEKLKNIRDLLDDTKGHLNRLIKAVNDLNLKSYNETNRDLKALMQTVIETQMANNKPQPPPQPQPQPQPQVVQTPQAQPSQLQPPQSQILQQSQDRYTSLMASVNHLSQMQQQLAQPNALNMKTLHSVLCQLISQLQAFMITLER